MRGLRAAWGTGGDPCLGSTGFRSSSSRRAHSSKVIVMEAVVRPDHVFHWICFATYSESIVIIAIIVRLS